MAQYIEVFAAKLENPSSIPEVLQRKAEPDSYGYPLVSTCVNTRMSPELLNMPKNKNMARDRKKP